MKNLSTTKFVVVFTLLLALNVFAHESNKKGSDKIQQKYYEDIVLNYEMLVQAVGMFKLDIDNNDQKGINFYSRLVKHIMTEDISLTTTKATIDKNKETTILLKSKRKLLNKITGKANDNLELKYRFMNRYIEVLDGEIESYRVKVASK